MPRRQGSISVPNEDFRRLRSGEQPRRHQSPAPCPPRTVKRCTLALLLWCTPVLAHCVEAAALYRVIADYYHAVGENRLDEAMGFYHQESPQFEMTRHELAAGQTVFLRRTSTMSIDVLHADDRRAVVVATHRHLRIVGVKFMEAYSETRYALRQQEGRWLIWSSTERRLKR